MATAIDQLEKELSSQDPARRRRTLKRLQSRASKARRRGVADADNAALHVVRTVLPPRKQGLQNLDRLGLTEKLRGRVQRRALYTLDLLLEQTGKDVHAITPEDVSAFVAGRPQAIEAVLRSNIRLCYDALIRQGLASENPSPIVKPRREALPPALACELERVERMHIEMRSARGTRRETGELMRRASDWAQSVGVAEQGLEALLWDDPERLRQLAFWWAQPRADSTLRAEACMSPLFKLLLRLWRAHGRSVVEGRDRIRALKRSLRSSGDDFGRLDLLDLRTEDPAPAPDADKCAAQWDWYAQEAPRLRAAGDPELMPLQRERSVYFILWKVGIRLSSLASLRFDQLKRDEEGMWYFDNCVTKRTRPPKRVVVQTWRVGDTTFSRWYVPDEFVDLLTEMLRDEGYDLARYLEQGDESCVPWDTAQDDTFGPHVRGKRISPVWRGKRGHLRKGAIAGIAARIVQERLGMPRGGAHAMRRRSIMDLDTLADRYPQAAEVLQHLTPETRAIYKWSAERSVRHIFKAASTGPAKTEERGPATSEAPARPRRARSTRAPLITIDDLR